MDKRDNIIQSLRTFIQGLHQVENYYDHLNLIFEMHFKMDKSEELIKNLHIHLVEVYHVDGMFLFEYLIYDQVFKIEDLELNSSMYKKSLECINNIKSKYGFFIRKELQSTRMPFLINAVEANISNNDSVHNIKFTRNDGECLHGLVNADTLMSLVITFINTLKISLTRGIFNLNKETIKKTYDEMNQLYDVLKKIEETYQEKVEVDADGK